MTAAPQTPKGALGNTKAPIDHTGWDFDPYYVALAAIFKLDTDVFQHDMEVIEL